MCKTLKISEKDYERIFVISDIHAHASLFKELLDKIKYTKKDLILILGDSCDRGNELEETYALLFSLEKKINLIHLIGNHEEMLYNYFVFDEIYPYMYKNNGGFQTVNFFNSNKKLLEKVLNYIEKMPDIVESENYIFVHAGINTSLPLKEQDIEYIRWTRKDFWLDNTEEDKTIIFGHTIQQNGEIRIYKYYNTIGIDCGTYKYNRLACYEIKSKKKIYVEGSKYEK